MLTRLRIGNFKAWKDTGTMELAPITVFFGSNSSGKTSLLQLLLMLKQTADSADRNQVLNLGDERSLVDLGSFQDIVYAHDLEATLKWKIGWKLLEPLKIEDPMQSRSTLFSDDALVFTALIGYRRKRGGLARAFVERMSYQLAGRTFSMQPISASKPAEYGLKAEPEDDDFRFIRTRGRVWQLPHPAKCYGFPDQVRAYFQNAGFLSDLEFEFEELCDRIFYLGPFREYPKRQYSWSGAQPTDMGRRGERVVDAILASREAGVLYSLGQGQRRQTLEERVAHWLKELGLIHSFRVSPTKRGSKFHEVWVKRLSRGPEVLIADVGFGVSQILPVITLCYYAPEGSIIILEQPGIHLHPAVQAGLADVLVDAVRTRKVQIILESHSEHLLRRLQRRIAENKLPAEDAALYFCSNRRGKSVAVPLKLDDCGTIANWPKGFFGDEFGEIAATQEAILRRKRGT